MQRRVRSGRIGCTCHPGSTGAYPIATPADWQPGDRVIVSLSMSTDDAENAFDNVEEFKPYLRYADALK